MHSEAASPLQYTARLVGEECVEVSQVIFKIGRFGHMFSNPLTHVGNMTALQKEVTDLVASIRLLNAELIRQGLEPLTLSDETGIQSKIDKVIYYSEYSIAEDLLSEPLALTSTGSFQP